MTILKRFLLALFLLTAAPAWADMTPVRFCIPNNMVGALAAIAQEKGYFKDENIALDVKTVTNAKMSNDLMLANNADIATGGDGPFTWVAFNPNPLRIVAQTHQVRETGVFARKDRGIASENDLPGKHIAYLPGTVSFLYFAELMEKHGWTLDQFKLTSLQPPAMPQALTGGTVDAFVMWEPWGYNALAQLGGNGLLLRDTQLYHYEAVIVTRNDYARKNPDVIKGVLRALLRAETFVTEHKDDAIPMLATAFKLDESYLRANWDLYSFRVALGDDLLTKLNRNADRIIKYMPDFKDKKKPDFRPFILADYLTAVDPSRVTLK